MVYLEHQSGTFWRCHKSAANTITISFGKCGLNSRTLIKRDLKNDIELKEYIQKQTTTKMKIGYSRAKDPNPPPSFKSDKKQKATTKKRKAAAKEEGETKKKTKKASLKGFSAPNLESVCDGGLVVDAGVAKLDCVLASKAKVHQTFHAKLALVTPSSDHYYIMQLLISKNTTNKSNHKNKAKSELQNNEVQYHLFSRWGRTGTSGQARLEGPWHNEEDASLKFAHVFESKVGVVWSKAIPGTRPKKGKYEYLQNCQKSSTSSLDGEWCYFLTDDLFGRADGWYKYDDENSHEVEQLYAEYMASGCAKRLSTRLVVSESSGFLYQIDLANMTQQNVLTSKIRPICRSIPTSSSQE